MDREDLFYLGYIVKTRGFKGEVSIYLDVDDPCDYKTLESVFVEIQQDPVPFFITSWRLDKKGFASAKLEGIDSEEQAGTLVSTRLFLPSARLPELRGNQFYYHEVIGFTIVDEHAGKVGTINRVLDYKQNPLFELKVGYKEVFIPINDEIIRETNRAEKTIRVSLPEGLLDIYLGGSAGDSEE